MSEAWALLLLRDEEDIELSRWVGAKVVMSAFRGRAFVEEPEEADLESVRVRKNFDSFISFGVDGS